MKNVFAFLRLAATVMLPATLSCNASPTPGGASPPCAASGVLGNLSAIAGSKTGKGVTEHNFVEIYERFLFQLRDEPIRIFEIGIFNGGSITTWQGYFPKARIFAVDIKENTAFDDRRTKTMVADQSKRDQLQKAIDTFGGDFDVLIDDGGHTMEQQQVSLGFLFKFVKPGGYYILEDVHTSLPKIYPQYGVEPDGSNSTLGMIEGFVHGSPATFESKYMLPEEKKYLAEHVEFANVNFRNNQHHSIVCIFKKK
jgi:hypothetical protein